MNAVQLATSRISVGLSNASNSRLLERLLGTGTTVQHLQGDLASQAFESDLLIVDELYLKRHREAIVAFRNRILPVIFPVLLVQDRRSATPITQTAGIDPCVDDVLQVPSTQAEIRSRVSNLLRLKAMSSAQADSRQQLAAVVSALRALNASDREILRSAHEPALLKSLCRAIIKEPCYHAAWIGFLSADQSEFKIQAHAHVGEISLADIQQWIRASLPVDKIRKIIRGNRARNASLNAEPDWRPQSATGTSCGSVLVLPLKTAAGASGCLAIYYAGETHFRRDQIDVLCRLGNNLTFKLNTLRLQQEKERQAAEIHFLAYTDALTGLPNRRHLINNLDRHLKDPSGAKKVSAVLFIDLDGFKLINDVLGHEIGDQVLRQIAQRLQGSLRQQDLVVRHGGDEFLVIMGDDARSDGSGTAANPQENAVMLGRRIIEALNQPLTAGGHIHHVSSSIGISLYPDHGLNSTTLIENADKAMYEAKRQGGGSVHIFTEEIAAGRERRFTMESKLRHALLKERLTLHYQPIFELETLKIVAVEALVRWPQDDGSIIMPGDFIPMAEEAHLIRPLGQWVLGEAARQLRCWHDAGHTLSMAVNLSVSQLTAPHDAEGLSSMVQPHIDPHWLHLEITEEALMGDPVAVENRLRKLRDKGFQIAIDDFGTGYSSLARLQQLPISTLKIDRSFTRELDVPGSKGAALVRVIQQMSRTLNLTTVVEGIETSTQRDKLIGSGNKSCGLGQGYWFSKPLDVEALEALLQRDASKR